MGLFGLFGKTKLERELTEAEQEEIKDLILKYKISEKGRYISGTIIFKIQDLTNKSGSECKKIYKEYEKEANELIYKRIKG